MNQTTSRTIESPCIQLCIIDPDSGLCCGCQRSLDEIATWSTLTTAERRHIMQQLPSRQNPPGGRD